MGKAAEWPTVNKGQSCEEQVLHISRVGRSGYCASMCTVILVSNSLY